MHSTAASADASTAASEMRSAAKMGTAATATTVETAATATTVETTTTATAVETTTAAAASSGRGVSGTDQRSGQSNDGKDFEP